jgi:Tfp pilus assembly protein PilO
MRQARSAPWIAGAAFLALLMSAAAWFFGISPTLDAASSMDQQAVDATNRADMLRVQLAALKKAYANLDGLKAELVALQTQIPKQTELSDLLRQLNNQAGQSGVFLESVNPGIPLSVVAPTATVPAPAAGATGDTAAGDTATGDTAAGDTATPAAAPAVTGFYAVPLQVTISGSFDATVAFLDQLAGKDGRLMVVNGVQATALAAAGAQGGRPEIKAGDLETIVSVWAYVLVDDGAPAPAASGDTATGTQGGTDTTTVPQLPVPSGQANPFSAT